MFFDRFPINSIVLPNIDTNDLQDIDTSMTPGIEYIAVKKFGLQKEVVQSYLAAVSFADSCVGLVLDALSKSAYANNTIVVLFGDNGFHLGEKLWYDKKTLWEESTRVPLLIKVPGMAPSSVTTPVSLCDIYPTLLDLCNLPANTNNEGESLKPLILNPLLSNTRVALTSSINTEVYSISGQTVRSKNWRYSVHESGALELYNHNNDPMEFINLASNITYDSTRNYMATQLNKALFKRNSTRLAVRTNYIPGIIQAEKYDMGGEGIAYHDEDTINFGGYYRMKDGVDIAPCLDSAGGLQIDSIKYGEWLTYTIKQIDSGGYNLKFRVLTNSTTTKTIKVFVNNVLAVQTNIPNTNNVWQTISSPVFNLQKKTNARLKVTFNGKDFKLNSFEFVKKPSVARSEAKVYMTENFLDVKPNPVSGDSQIYFTMAEDGIANLYITNTSGEKVCTILNEYMSKGIKEVNFVPSQYNLPAGIYFFTIKANNQQDCSKKIIISK
nr:sulfatase-like hydrolase/transferase [Bacteroidota bacterium]